MEKLLKLEKSYNFSFINEIMFFKREYINEILKKLNVDSNGFFNMSVDILNDMNQDAGMSEYELYGNFVTKYFPNSYNYNHIKTYLGGKYSIWNDQDVYNYIKSFEKSDFDIVSMHSWI